MSPPIHLNNYIDEKTLDQLIAIARAEDLGAGLRDLTSELLIDSARQGEAQIRSRAEGVLCGGALLEQIARAYDTSLRCDIAIHDGEWIDAGEAVAQVRGPLGALLAFERTALNFLTHLSGIATLTDRYVRAVADTAVQIYDTRKTIPGLRGLAKYAVVCGGGCSHRMGLYDAVLIKDNHLAHVSADKLGETIATMVVRAREMSPKPDFIEIEVDTLTQLRAVLMADVDVVLLDNMPAQVVQQAVKLRNELAAKVQLEASGGVNLETVLGIAETGVDRIAVGALTHSAAALDIGMDIELA